MKGTPRTIEQLIECLEGKSPDFQKAAIKDFLAQKFTIAYLKEKKATGDNKVTKELWEKITA